MRGQRFGNVRGRYGAEHLIALARLACELQRDDIQQLGLLVRRVELRGSLFGQRAANALDGFEVPLGGFHRELARQQVIARITGLDGYHVAAVSQFIDVFLKNDLHLASLSSCVVEFQVVSSKLKRIR